MTLEEQIPGLGEALSRERISRGASFLPIQETVCGVDVGPLTLGNIIALESIESPFVAGGAVFARDVATFLIIVSGARGWRRRRLLRRVGKMGYPAAVDSITGFVAEAMQDSPAIRSEIGDGAQHYSCGAAIVDLLAKEYGWREADILAMPLKRIFQYFKIIARRGGEKVMFNPSDKVRGEWLSKANN